MTNQEFDALAARVSKGTASAQEAKTFVKHASYLRALAIVSINDTDTWDHEHPEVSYDQVDDEDGSVGDGLIAWANKHGATVRWG